MRARNATIDKPLAGKMSGTDGASSGVGLENGLRLSIISGIKPGNADAGFCYPHLESDPHVPWTRAISGGKLTDLAVHRLETTNGRSPILAVIHIPENDPVSEGRKGWVLIAGEDFGKGMSPEQFSLMALFLRKKGCICVAALSFHVSCADCHSAETELKKHGILPLTFSQSSVYATTKAGHTMTLNGLDEIFPPKNIGTMLPILVYTKPGCAMCDFGHYNLSDEEIGWIMAGSQEKSLDPAKI
jgi:hypothetical protein